MRFNLPILRRLSEALRKRDWFGIGFELFVVVVGVMLGMAASRWAAERDDREYRRQILVSLDQTLHDYEYQCGRIHDQIIASLAEFGRRTAKGERPPPPVIVFPGMERPPTRAWEAVVATGVARSIDPELMFRLATHFDRADSWGDKYQRYNVLTEQQILPHEGNSAHFYGPGGKLKPMFAAHIGRLRDLLLLNDQMGQAAAGIRRDLKAPEAEVRKPTELEDDLPLRS